MAQTTDTDVKAFTLGDKGVNLVATPLHVELGELARAQNVVFSLDRAKHGLTKRPGMTKFNTDAMGGAILALQSVPLPIIDDAGDAAATTPDGICLYVFTEDLAGVTEKQTQSTDGVTWTQPTGKDQDDCGRVFRDHLLHKTGGILLSPKAKAATDPIAFQTYDGTTWADAFTMADRTIGTTVYQARDLKASDQDDNNFYLLVRYTRISGGAGESHYSVVQIDKTTYAETYLGAAFSEGAGTTGVPAGTYAYSYVVGVAVFNGQVYVIGNSTTGSYEAARVWAIAPGGTTWTLDMSLGGTAASASYAGRRICGHGHQLWASWLRSGSDATAPIFRKRDGEIWSTVETGVVSGEDYFDPIFAVGDQVWAWKTPDPGDDLLQLWYSADAWATSSNTGATAATGLDVVTRALRFSVNDKIYCVTGNVTSSEFEIWELTTATRVFYNAPATQGGAGGGLLGAAIAPPPGPSGYGLPSPDAADPTLPPAPGSVMAKCAAYLVANASIPAFLETPIAFGATVFNVGPMYSTANPRQLTVPYGGAGYYTLTGQVAWENAAGTRGFWAHLVVNGTPVARNFIWGNVTSEYVFCRVSALLRLVDGDRIQLMVQQQGSGSWTVIAGLSYTFLHAIRTL